MDSEEKSVDISVGVSGVNFRDWPGAIYPEDMPEDDRLAFCVTTFGLDQVEIDGSYVENLPLKAMAQARTANDSLRFVVQAPLTLTKSIRDHHGDFLRDETALKPFMTMLKPMAEDTGVTATLLRFPLKLQKTISSIEHVKWVAGEIRRITPVVVEFHHPSWSTPSGFELFKQHDLSYCAVDLPDLETFPPLVPATTNQLGYVRLHGRNNRWSDAPAKERYQYRYTDYELRSILDPIRQMAESANKVMVVFNNHGGGGSILDARIMKKLLANP